MAGQTVIKMFGLYTLNQDEIGVRLFAGRLTGIARPGPGWSPPIIGKVIKTKSSLQTMDLPDQQVVLSGNIAVTISGNLNFRVGDPAKALLTVGDYRYSIQRLSMTTMSDVLSTKTIEEVRTEKATIADEIEAVVAKTADQWGLVDVDIRLTDAKLDDSLLRAMMRETEALKEAKAIQIKAGADLEVAKMFAEAARTLATSPGAMTLRVLQTLNDISSEKSTVVVPIPMDLLGTAMRASMAAPPPIAEMPAEPSTPPEPAKARLEFRDDKTVAYCPSCKAKYDVTEILGRPEVDARPGIPGQQIDCSRCGIVFTLGKE